MIFKKNLFYLWLHWIFTAAHGLPPVAVSGGYSSLRCTGFSLRWPLPLRSTGSRPVGLSSCGARAQLLCGMWDLPRLGLEPMFPALAGGLPNTAPPRKPLIVDYFMTLYLHRTKLKVRLNNYSGDLNNGLYQTK